MPLDIFGDFGFVGGSNRTANPYQDQQVCINWYPEISPSPKSKTAASLLSAPGLVQVAAAPGGGAPGFSLTQTIWPAPSSVVNLPVRGSWVLPGRQQALVVIANVCYLATIVKSGSTYIPGVLGLTKVGLLNTSSGPVCIRDTGILGGFAVIVDGPNGYYYVYNAAGNTLGPNGTYVQITDPAFLGANTVAFIDGWLIYNQPGTQTFYTNKSQYSSAFAAGNFANKDAFTDLLMAVVENKEALWLPGEITTEIWYDAGGQFFAFARLTGTVLQVGCRSAASIAKMSNAVTGGQDNLIWYGRTEHGENTVIKTKGLNYEVVSTPAISDELAASGAGADTIAYTYQEDSHQFYVLTSPVADRTWVYDASMPLELAWTHRPSYDPYAAQFHRHRSNCFMNFGGMRVVGDYQNGTLYQLTRAVQNDAGWPMYARRRAPYIWNKEDRERTHVTSLQIDFAPSVGAPSGLGQNPLAYLTYAKDAGLSLGSPFGPAPSNTFPAAMNVIGEARNRTMWRKLGWSRSAVAQIDVIAPVNRDIVGATLKGFGP